MSSLCLYLISKKKEIPLEVSLFAELFCPSSEKYIRCWFKGNLSVILKFIVRYHNYKLTHSLSKNILLQLTYLQHL